MMVIIILLSGCSTQYGAPSLEAEGVWDYVALGDSIPAGYGVNGHSYVTYYADYIEDDMGVQVRVHNYSIPGQTTKQLLGTLQNDQQLRDAIKEAEVITIWTGWNDVAPLIGSSRFGMSGLCGKWDDLDLECVREGVEELKTDINELIAEIHSLRNANDAIIRIADNCNHAVGEWVETGIFQDLKELAFEDWSRAVTQTASRFNIPVVHTYRVLNGQNGDDVIPEKFLWEDGIHFNAKGHILIADLHRSFGYEFNTP